MPLNDGALNAGADAMAGKITHLALHTADPGAGGGNESTAARVIAGWPAASAGDISVSNKAFTGGAASGPCTYVGLWGEAARVAISSADAPSNVITTSAAHGFAVGDPVVFRGSVPAGLSTTTLYYVASVPSATTLTVSTTRGGAAVDITATGTGEVGRFYGSYALTGDQAFNAAGEYTITSLALNGSSS
ncbi:MAG: hypothetical protein ACOYY2_12735 [Actinomycetota bacterium]